MSAPVSSRCIGNAREFFGSSNRTEIDPPSLIDFEEDKFGAAINQRFVTKKNIKAKNAIESGTCSVRVR